MLAIPADFHNGAMAQPLAIALLSGGLDSATAAALAREAGLRVIGLSLDYGQRHRRELEAAATLATALELEEHHCVAVNLAAWGGSALTDPAIVVPSGGVEPGVIPSTYVPGRNTVFIALALSLAEARGAERVVLGVRSSSRRVRSEPHAATTLQHPPRAPHSAPGGTLLGVPEATHPRGFPAGSSKT